MNPLAAAVVGLHLVKCAGLANNAAAFPLLRPGDGPAVSTALLVPARNEADNLTRTLPGFLAQPVDEILIGDDGSRDATADVVAGFADPRLRLIPVDPPPAGWTGKNWACHTLARQSRSDLLVFCDADVTLRPGAIGAVRAETARQHADALSVFPRQHTGTLGERLLVPLIDDTLLAYLPHQLLRAPVPSAATANGQLFAFRRSAYDIIGGHESVAGRIVEDVALGRAVRRHGLRLGLALGGHLVEARMYHGYRAAVRGIGKSLREAHLGSDLLLAASATVHLVAYTLPWLLWNDGLAWRVAALLGLAERVAVNAKTGRRAYAEAALVPVTAPAALPVYALALRRAARWKGREYR